MPRQAFVLSGRLTSAYYNKGSALNGHKDYDNFKHHEKLILRNVHKLKIANFSLTRFRW